MKKYILIIVAIFISIGVGTSIYKETTKEKVIGKAKRIPCQAKVTSFERSYDNDEIKVVQELLKTGHYILSSDIDKATFMNSTLFDFLDMKELDNLVKKELDSLVVSKNTKNAKEKNIKVEYTVYENDKEDPKKKSKTCKLYRGYVVMKFKNSDNKTVYQIQIDFMDGKGSDVPQALSCAIQSFITYK